MLEEAIENALLADLGNARRLRFPVRPAPGPETGSVVIFPRPGRSSTSGARVSCKIVFRQLQ
jgi:hypothetical protein